MSAGARPPDIGDTVGAALQELFGIGNSPAAQAVRDRQQAAETARQRQLVRLIRVVVRAELAAQAKLPQDVIEQTIRDAWATLKPFESVVDLNDGDQQSRTKSVDQLRQIFEDYFSTLTPNGPQSGVPGEHGLGGQHGRGDLVEQDGEHVADLVGGRHNSSPSLVDDASSVGEPGSGDGESPEPGTTTGGAR